MTNLMGNDKSSENKVNILASVSTPLKFFALVVLVIEIILAKMANSVEGADRTYLIIGMIGALVLMIIMVALIEIFRPRSQEDENGNHPQPLSPEVSARIFKNNDSHEFSELFEHHLKTADKIYMIGTGFSILRRDPFRLMLEKRIRSNCELKIYAANPFSPNVQTRLIEEEIGEPAPMIRQQGLVDWLRSLLDRHDTFSQSSNFSLNLFPFYPTYALFIFDEQDYFFYPYGYAQLGTLSPVMHFSKHVQRHHSMVEFFNKQFKFISESSSNADLVFKIQDSKFVEPQNLSAFAVYLIPPASSKLYRFGSEVLEYDVHASKKLSTNKWHDAIGTASDFGFHLTVADALYCTHPKDVDLICREIEFIAKKFQPFALKFHIEKDFPNENGIALVCEDESGLLESMHHEIVARVYRKASASNYSRSLGCIARPDRDPNKKRARNMIQRYHAPYILQMYKPHFSLLSAVKVDEKEQIFGDIRNRYDEYKLEPEVQIHNIAVMHRPDLNKPWQILKEYRLGGI